MVLVSPSIKGGGTVHKPTSSSKKTLWRTQRQWETWSVVLREKERLCDCCYVSGLGRLGIRSWVNHGVCDFA